MLDGLTLDQLRTFIAASDAGSFSAAGRNLGRAQSVVSQTLANLEAQIGIKVFDRAGRLPVLTDAGHALLGEARVVIGGMDQFKAIAKDLAGGLEPELSVAVDVMFPIEVLTCAVSDFQAKFPNTPLRLYVEALGAVIRPVIEGHCAFGIMGSLPIAPPQLKLERLLGVSMIMVASPRHPLAKHRKPIPAPQLSEHIQLVLTDRSDRRAGRNSASSHPGRGGWRTWARSTRSCVPRSGGAACQPVSSSKTSQGVNWSRSSFKTCRQTAT